jgi:methylenetetrahydrofolate--tRNA-(uracil-5-)-methyltransferase
VQLRQDNALGTLYNMVGFQTKLKHGEQVRVFRMIPGWRTPSSRGSAACTATPSSTRRSCWTAPALKASRGLRFAGQITGVEGYVESAAIGLLAGRLAAAERLGPHASDAAAAAPPPGRAARPHHRRRRGQDLPADERQLRPVPSSTCCAVARSATS